MDKELENSFIIVKRYINDGGDKKKVLDNLNYIEKELKKILTENKAHSLLYNEFIIDCKSIFGNVILEKKEEIKEMFKESLTEFSENEKNKNKESLKNENGANFDEMNQDNNNNNIQIPLEIHNEIIFEPKINIIPLKIYYSSEYTQHFETLSNYFNSNSVQILNNHFKIQLEHYNTFIINQDLNNIDKKETEIVLFVQMCFGMRIDRNYKDKIELLKEKCNNIVFTTLLIGEKSVPVSIDDFNGFKLFFQIFKNDVYNNEFNKNSLISLCNFILKNKNIKQLNK